MALIGPSWSLANGARLPCDDIITSNSYEPPLRHTKHRSLPLPYCSASAPRLRHLTRVLLPCAGSSGERAARPGEDGSSRHASPPHRQLFTKASSFSPANTATPSLSAQPHPCPTGWPASRAISRPRPPPLPHRHPSASPSARTPSSATSKKPPARKHARSSAPSSRTPTRSSKPAGLASLPGSRPRLETTSNCRLCRRRMRRRCRCRVRSCSTREGSARLRSCSPMARRPSPASVRTPNSLPADRRPSPYLACAALDGPIMRT